MSIRWVSKYHPGGSRYIASDASRKEGNTVRPVLRGRGIGSERDASGRGTVSTPPAEVVTDLKLLSRRDPPLVDAVHPGAVDPCPLIPQPCTPGQRDRVVGCRDGADVLVVRTLHHGGATLTICEVGFRLHHLRVVRVDRSVDRVHAQVCVIRVAVAWVRRIRLKGKTGHRERHARDVGLSTLEPHQVLERPIEANSTEVVVVVLVVNPPRLRIELGGMGISKRHVVAHRGGHDPNALGPGFDVGWPEWVASVLVVHTVAGREREPRAHEHAAAHAVTPPRVVWPRDQQQYRAAITYVSEDLMVGYWEAVVGVEHPRLLNHTDVTGLKVNAESSTGFCYTLVLAIGRRVRHAVRKRN